MPAQATSPTKRSTEGVQATDDAGIVDQVEGVVDEQWSGILGDGLVVLPGTWVVVTSPLPSVRMASRRGSSYPVQI